jgi:alkanesulfonate monooxygenase SsuD/methylene tetrahydromethanopterin reductase-like flavin-dependent oxidoreductase (luciferase family)
MIWSDVYAMLALAADRTSTINVGTGVAVAGTRLAPVTAAAIATINELAPGRTFCGIGTGNTAMRIMGHPPMRIAEFDRYLADLRPLLRGEEINYEWRGHAAPVQHLMPDDGFVRFDPPVPVHVSAFGPRALDLAAKHGDGLITSAPPDPQAIRGLRQIVSERRAAHGRSAERADFPMATLTTVCVLEPGEAADSERVKQQVGAFAIAGLHYAYEQYTQLGREPARHLHDIWDDYVATLESIPADRRHLRTHLGHNCWVVPDEERFVTKSLIGRSCLVGEPGALRERVAELDEAGLDQIVVLPPLAHKEQVIREVSRELIAPG